MEFDQLEPWEVFTGITFGQECYLDNNRSQAFFEKVHEETPDFFTRYDFSMVPNRFALSHPEKRELSAMLDRLVYKVYQNQQANEFLAETKRLFDHFRHLWALGDIRRVGKVFNFMIPHESPDKILSQLLTIKEDMNVNQLNFVFHREDKNINMTFRSIRAGTQIGELKPQKLVLDPAILIRCDINNIDTDSPLPIGTIFENIFHFADNYIDSEFPEFLTKYLRS